VAPNLRDIPYKAKTFILHVRGPLSQNDMNQGCGKIVQNCEQAEHGIKSPWPILRWNVHWPGRSSVTTVRPCPAQCSTYFQRLQRGRYSVKRAQPMS
jgi:hypothetical protein